MRGGRWLAMAACVFLAGCNPTDQGQVVDPGTNVVAKATNRVALCIGINNYPNPENRLAGCINDCNDWVAELRNKWGFAKISVLQDSQATVANVTAALHKLIAEAVPGDVIVVTYSGHGTYIQDKNGDEPDSRDEALYLYDGLLVDDVIREILAGLKQGVSLTVISDSCFSGTVTRMPEPGSEAAAAKPRVVFPEGATFDTYVPVKGRAFISEESMNEVLLSGASDKEYSYDAKINGRPNGALTYYALYSLHKLGGRPTYAQWHAEIRKHLPGAYPQTPQLEGRAENKAKPVF